MESEALIAVLFLTQTSGGSSIMFRYPPHPRQPLRVSRPIYERATPEGAAQTAKRRKLGGYKDRARPYLGAETSISQAAQWKENREAGGTGTSPDSDDTDLDDVEEARWTPLHAAPGDMQEGRVTRERKAKPGTLGQERVKDRRGNERVKGWNVDGQSPATGSPAVGSGTTEATASSSSGGGSGDIREYDQCLGYELAVLNALLSPQRALCHKRFQLVVDDLVFLGHPVCADEDGKWKIPEEGAEEVESTEPERGRRNRSDAAAQPASKAPRNMDVITEGVVADSSPSPHPSTLSSSISTLPTSSGTITPNQPDSGKTETPPITTDSEPLVPLTAFHMVMVLDKPDRSVADPSEMDLDSMYDSLYSEAVFKWTAAAWAEQARDSWVSKEARKIGSVREEAITRFMSLKQAQAQVFGVSSLAMSLRVLYEGITNNTATQIQVGSLPLDIRLPPHDAPVIEEWTRWGDGVSEDSDDSNEEDDEVGYSDEEEVAERQSSRQRWIGVELKPWKTLIELPAKKEGGDGVALLGSGTSQVVGPFAMTDLKDGLAEDRDYLDPAGPAQRLLSALNPMVPLVTIAAELDLDLENELYPLARYLVHTERAKLIDVVRPSLRNVFMPDTISNKSLPAIMRSWSAEFPYLPGFDRFISRISASPQPYRKLLPDVLGDNDKDVYTRALFWALSNDLLIQVHEYVRIVARSEVKAQAKKQLVDNVQAKRRQRLEDTQSRRASQADTGPSDSTAHESEPVVTVSTDGQSGVTDPFRRSSVNSSPDNESGADKDALGFLRDLQPAIIDKPGKASPAESRCLRIIMDSQEEVWQKRFAMCMRYFDGKHSLEEIQYQTDLTRKIVRQVLTIFHADLIIFQHP